jgi:hypothetical protein
MSLFRFFARKTFALAVLFCLSTALLFTGCKMEPELGPYFENTGFIPVGTWIAEWDSYTITNTSVEYGELKGAIEKAIGFPANAGVLIIKITASDDYGNYTVGKYTGVYYSEYTSTRIKLANAWVMGSGFAHPAEADSLSAAVSLFCVDNVSDHVYIFGVYTKK